MRGLNVLAAIVLAVAPNAPAKAEIEILSEAPLADPRSSEELIRSAITDRVYRVRIWEPLQPQAKESSPALRIPNLFVLDGEQAGGLAAALARMVNARHPHHGVRVVSVAAEDDRREPSFMRIKSPALSREFLHRPLNISWVENGLPAGDGLGFQRFLIEELKPMIEKRYPDSGAAALFGDGIAGTFVTSVAATAPDAFQLYAAYEPWLDDATASAIAAEVKPPSRRSHAVKYLIGVNVPEHVFPTREPQIGNAFKAKEHAAEWREDESLSDLIVETIGLLLQGQQAPREP